MNNLSGAYVRRQEMVCTEADLTTYGDKVLLDGEVIYVRMNDGSVKQKMGNGTTPVSDLPFTDFGVEKVNTAAQEALTEIADAKAEMLGEIELAAEIVQTTGYSETAVMSQKAVTDELNRLSEEIADECSLPSVLNATMFESGSFEEQARDHEEPRRIRLASPIRVNAGTIISINRSDYYFAVYEHNAKDRNDKENTQILHFSGWFNSSYTIKNDCYITVLIANGSSYGTSEEIDVNDFPGAIEIERRGYSTLAQELQETEAIFTSDIAPKQAYFETKGSSGVYVKIGGKLYVRGVGVDRDIVWDTHFADSFITSPSGVENCIFIGHNKTLVYDYVARSYSIINGFIPNENQVAIFKVGYGNINNFANEGIIGGIGLWYYLEWLISQQSKGTTSELPLYWQSHIANKLPYIHSNIEESALNGDTFAFFTDYHIENNSGFSHLILNKIKEETGLSDVVFGGDVFNGNADRETALGYLREFRKRFSEVSLYGIRGNHEYNLNDGGSESVKLSESEIYSNLIRGVEDRVIVTNTYYYKDNANKKLRYIFLDAEYENASNPIDDEQITWMEERIRELESGWSVIVFSHQLFKFNPSNGTAVTQNPGYNASGTKIINSLIVLNDSVSATIIAIICGHGHYDFSTNEHGFLEIATTCDTGQEVGGLSHSKGTANEHAIDIFSVNPVSRTLKSVRIGRGENRAWNY